MAVDREAAAVRLERRLSAPPDSVFRAWIEPALLAGWMSPVGYARAEVDARPGGALKVTMVGDGREIAHTGEYRELIPGRRIVFTWNSPYTGPEPSVVTVELEPDGDGTLLTLVHDFLPADQVESHGGGWGRMLDRLVARLPSSSGRATS